MPSPAQNGQWVINHPAITLVIGAGTPYPVARVQGMGQPDVKDQDLDLPVNQGGRAFWAGTDRFAAREIVLEIGIDGEPDSAAYGTLVNDLRTAWSPVSADVRYDFMRWGQLFYVMGRPRGLVLEWDDAFHLGAARALGRIICADPEIH
jgi:hypothetical protein